MKNKYIKNLLNEYHKRGLNFIFGDIDPKVLSEDCFFSLLYIFPLIERLCLEMLSYDDTTSIEAYGELRYKELFSILYNENHEHEKDFLKKYIGQDDFDVLNIFFARDGFRDNVFHPGENREANVNDTQKVKLLLLQIIIAFNKVIDNYDVKDQTIPLIKI